MRFTNRYSERGFNLRLSELVEESYAKRVSSLLISLRVGLFASLRVTESAFSVANGRTHVA